MQVELIMGINNTLEGIIESVNEQKGRDLRSAVLSVLSLIGLILIGSAICPVCFAGACAIGASVHFQLPLCIVSMLIGIVLFSTSINITRILRNHNVRFRGQLLVTTFSLFGCTILIYRLWGLI